MKITEQEIRDMVVEALKKKHSKQTQQAQPSLKKKAVKESADYMAGRQVIVSAQQASLDFEKEIIKTLGLVNPDEIHPNIRKRFNEIVETMKDNIVSAVKVAVDGLSPFPRVDDVANKGNQGQPSGNPGSVVWVTQSA